MQSMTMRTLSSTDPFSPESLADPYPAYARLRAEGPVVLHEARDVWVVTGYDAVRHVLRAHDVFCSGTGIGYRRADASMLRSPLNDSDPPGHSRVRRLVQRDFTPTATSAHGAVVATAVEAVVRDALDARVVDAVATIARPLPVAVMADLLGFRHPDAVAVSRMMDSVFHTLGPDPSHEHLQRAGELFLWIYQDGLPALEDGTLGHAIMSGDGDLVERISLLGTIWIAGVDTTTNLIGSVLDAFGRAPAQWRAVVDDPALAPAAVEEALRFRSPIRSFMRRTTEPTTLFGAELPADADVCVVFAAANRDPAHYEDPDEFRVARNPTDHVAFGSGVHLCLGAPFLRLVATQLVTQLAARVAAIEPTGTAVHNPSAIVQGFLELPVELRPR